jgi:hypothetical protein
MNPKQKPKKKVLGNRRYSGLSVDAAEEGFIGV